MPNSPTTLSFCFFFSPPVINTPLLGAIRATLGHVQTQAGRVEVDLVVAGLQNVGDLSGVLELPQVDVAARLLDGVTDELGRTGLTLGADDGGLLLLAGLVDDEGGTLSLLLGDLLGLNGGGELGGKGEVLWVELSAHHVERSYLCILTVNETSSSMMLKRAALRTKLSLTSLLTFSRWVISWLALN